MIHKTFFTYDLELSRHSKAIAYYNYRGEINHDRDISSSSPHNKYPIYLTISKNKVCFYLHYYTSDSNPQHKTLHHTNSPILTLSVEPDSEMRDSLTTTLRDIFQETIILKAGAQQKEMSKEFISYSTLEVFSEKKRKPALVDGQHICLRELFLNFLFTAEHTQIFQASPSFSHIYRELNRNFLFLAIRNKAEYYYQRVLSNECLVEGLKNKGKARELHDSDQKRIIFQLAHLYDVEKAWVATITALESERCFHDARQWMMSSKGELDPLFTPSKSSAALHGKGLLEKFLKCKGRLEEHERARIEQYEELHLETENRALAWYLSKYQLGGFYRILYGKYWKYPHHLFQVLLIAFAVFFIIQNMYMLSAEYYAYFLLGSSLLFIYPWIAWLLASMQKVRIGIKLLDNKKSKMSSPEVSIPKPKRNISLAELKEKISRIRRKGKVCLAKQKKNVNLEKLKANISLEKLKVNISFAQVEKKIRRAKRNGKVCLAKPRRWLTKLKKAIQSTRTYQLIKRIFAIQNIKLTNIFFPRLLAAIIAAWCTMSVDDAIYTNFFDKQSSLTNDLNATETKYIATIVISLGMTLWFIYNEIRKKNPFQGLFFTLRRLLSLGFIAFFYATVAGIFAMNYFAGDYIENSDVLPEFYNSRVFSSSPDFILPSSRVEEFTTTLLRDAIEKHDNDLLLELIAMPIYDTVDEQINATKNSEQRTVTSPDRELTSKKAYQILSILSVMPISCERGIMAYASGSIEDRLDKLRIMLINSSYTMSSLEQKKLNEFTQDGGDTSWIYLLKVLGDPKIYRETLSELHPRGTASVYYKIATKVYGVEIMHNLLYQFTILAMFFGIFVQSFFSEKSVGDPA